MFVLITLLEEWNRNVFVLITVLEEVNRNVFVLITLLNTLLIHPKHITKKFKKNLEK